MSKLKFIAMILVTSIIFVIFGHVMLDHNSLKAAVQALNQHYWIITLCRYAVYLFIIIMWPYFISFLGKRQKWSAETIASLSEQQIRLGLLLAIIEIFYIYNVIGHIFFWLKIV